MKKSRSIQLTVVAALSMAARAQQGSPTPSAAQSCEERRSAAQLAGVTFNEKCGHSAPAHGAAHGGFGATGEAHSVGE